MLSFIARLLRSFAGREQPSPQDWVKFGQITYSNGLLTIKLEPDIQIFGIADTNSMDGLLDIGHNVIATNNFNRADLAVGDIVVYQMYTDLIIHRIVEIKQDNSGRIYRCRGDNNVNTDPYYLRDAHIKWLVLGVIY